MSRQPNAGRVESRSPHHPADVVAEVPAASAADVARAANAARAAFAGWRRATPDDRSSALRDLAASVEAQADVLARLIVREVGKPISEARVEVFRAVKTLEYFAQHAWDEDGVTHPGTDGRSLVMTRRVPRGVAGLITPWNFPLLIPIWKAAPALVYGNTVLVKPSSEAIGVASALGQIATSVLPEGVLSILPGGAATGEAVVASVDLVSMTGSTQVGASVRRQAAERGIPVQCETGGQNATIVLPGADRQDAAKQVARASMAFAGQKCTATSRVIVIGDTAPFVEALLDAVAGLGFGDPSAEDVSVGPVISRSALDAVIGAADAVADAGGRVLRGGCRAELDGWFAAPTVVDRIQPSHPVAQEEVFGPLLVVLRADGLDSAAAINNGVRYGLVTSVYGGGADDALAFADRLDTGIVRVNAPTTGVDFHVPFGGAKESSYGEREQGRAARSFYTESRTLSVTFSG